MFKKLDKTTRALIYGRDGISPNVHKFMRNHFGNDNFEECCYYPINRVYEIDFNTQFRERV